MRRYAQVIGVRPEMFEEYERLHRAVWPEVLLMIRECNIRNYSIFFRDGLLFSYFEYVGLDYAADMARMATDPKTREWWKLTDPCQQPVETSEKGEWWAPMQELFHSD